MKGDVRYVPRPAGSALAPCVLHHHHHQAVHLDPAALERHRGQKVRHGVALQQEHCCEIRRATRGMYISCASARRDIAPELQGKLKTWLPNNLRRTKDTWQDSLADLVFAERAQLADPPSTATILSDYMARGT